MKSSEITNYGYLAFKSGDFDGAINYFSSLDSKSASYWNGQMYLAMSYFYVGKASSAKQAFKDISEWCPDTDLKQRAICAMRELNAVKNAFA